MYYEYVSLTIAFVSLSKYLQVSQLPANVLRAWKCQGTHLTATPLLMIKGILIQLINEQN